MKKLVLTALMAAAALAANAAEPVGTLSKVEGIVSIGGKGFTANAGNGAVLLEGSTVTVSTRGKATIVLNDGCVLPLRGGQFVTINPKLTCSQLYSSVTQLFTPYRLAQAPVGGGIGGLGAGLGGSALIVGGVVIGTGLLLLNAEDTSSL